MRQSPGSLCSLGIHNYARQMLADPLLCCGATPIMRDFAELFPAGPIAISRLQTSKKSRVPSCAVAWSFSLERKALRTLSQALSVTPQPNQVAEVLTFSIWPRQCCLGLARQLRAASRRGKAGKAWGGPRAFIWSWPSLADSRSDRVTVEGRQPLRLQQAGRRDRVLNT